MKNQQDPLENWELITLRVLPWNDFEDKQDITDKITINVYIGK